MIFYCYYSWVTLVICRRNQLLTTGNLLLSQTTSIFILTQIPDKKRLNIIKFLMIQKEEKIIIYSLSGKIVHY